MSSSISRRSFLIGSTAAFLVACSDPEPVAGPSLEGLVAPPASWTDPLTAAHFDPLPICQVLPASSRGPFPNQGFLDRQDITDGVTGRPFRFGLRVVDDGCVPVSGAAVEIWHTDASGDYSQYEDGGSGKDQADGTNFCRGIQTAGADGIVDFHSIYPGWYDSRAVHVHATVFVGDQEMLTTQLYFDETYTAKVLATGEYAEFGLPDTSWATDSVAGDPVGEGTAIALMDIEREGQAATLGLISLGVRIA